MAVDNYELPKRSNLARVVSNHIEREESRMSWRWLSWNLAYHYLNGARRFDIVDPHGGKFLPFHLDEEGNLEFQCQEVLAQIDRVAGILNSMDVRAKVMRRGAALPAIRDRAVAQVISDAVTVPEQLDVVQSQFAFTFACLGSCGLTGHIVDHPTVGLTSDYEMVHPREVFPFPSLGRDFSKQRGIIRQRIVSLSYLKERFGRTVSNSLDDMEWWEIDAGENPEAYDDIYGLLGGETMGSGWANGRVWTDKNPMATEKNATQLGVARVRELWMYGPAQTVTRYAVMSGNKVLSDEDYAGLEVYCPLSFERFIETGSFHGAGIFDLLFGVGRWMERMLKSLFNNVRDMDRYGVLVLPQGEFNERANLQEVGRGLRTMFWAPDPIGEGFNPFTIEPQTLGDVPGKTAAFAKDLFDKLSPQQDLLAEKGRVDSAAGLGFLDEKIRGRMSNATAAMSRAFSSVHRYTATQAARIAITSKRALPINSLSLDLAGVIIDPETDEVTFSGNRVPNFRYLSFTIRESNPRSEVARKQEAIQLFQMEGLNDPMRFILFALREGLDFATDMEEERAAYETVVRNALLLFGDGQSPQEIAENPHWCMPQLQLRVLQSFMGSPIMSVASPDVQEAFLDYKEFLRNSMGLTLPEGVPNPEDLLAMRTSQEILARLGPLPETQGQQQQMA